MKLLCSVTTYKKMLTKIRFQHGGMMIALYLLGFVICEHFMTDLVLWNALKKARSSTCAPGICIQPGRHVQTFPECCALTKIGNFGLKISKTSGMI